MKRIISLLLAALIVSLTGCGEKERPLELGTVEGEVYTNSFLGLGIKLDGWVYSDQKELDEENGVTEDMTDTEREEYLKNAAVVVDMSASDTAWFRFLSVNFEKLTADMTEKEYIESQLDGLKSSMESIGLENLRLNVTERELAGETHAALTVAGDYPQSGVTIYETLVCVKVGGYMSNITATTLDKDDSDDVLKGFYKL